MTDSWIVKKNYFKSSICLVVHLYGHLKIDQSDACIWYNRWIYGFTAIHLQPFNNQTQTNYNITKTELTIEMCGIISLE